MHPCRPHTTVFNEHCYNRKASLKGRCSSLYSWMLCFMKHFYRSLESSRVRALQNTVNVWVQMSHVTSRSLEQFGWFAVLKWPRDGLESTWRQCWSSGRKNVPCKLLRIPYHRLKVGFSVCWVCLFVVLWQFWLRLNEIHEVRPFAPWKSFLFVFDVVVVVDDDVFVTWKLLWTQNQC